MIGHVVQCVVYACIFILLNESYMFNILEITFTGNMPIVRIIDKILYNITQSVSKCFVCVCVTLPILNSLGLLLFREGLYQAFTPS